MIYKTDVLEVSKGVKNKQKLKLFYLTILSKDNSAHRDFQGFLKHK